MSYDPETRKRSCDVCGSSDKKRRYYLYGRGYGRATKHLCTACQASGAYWCWACETLHARRNKCPQLPMPLDVQL